MKKIYLYSDCGDELWLEDGKLFAEYWDREGSHEIVGEEKERLLKEYADIIDGDDEYRLTSIG